MDDTTREPPATTRRAVLKRGARVGALLVTGAMPASATDVPVEPAESTIEPAESAAFETEPIEPATTAFEIPGQPSRRAYHALATIERQVADQSGSIGFDRVVDAAEYLDLGPDTPVDRALERADEAGDLDGVRLDFSPGTYRLAGDCTISPDGAFGIVGPRATFRLDSGVRCAVSITGLEYGVFEGLTFDQRARNAAVSLVVSTEGHIDARAITYRGAVEALDDDQPALLRPVAANREASVRVDHLEATGGTNAGAHEWVGSGSPPAGQIPGGVPGAFVGPANEGVVQFVEPHLRGWENGLYAARTAGAVQVIGGQFVNNNNTAVRISGAESFCDGATIVLDAARWPEDQPGEFTIGEIQGVSAARSETGALDKRGARFANLDVRAYAMDQCLGLVIYRGSAGAGRMDRCRLRNHLDGTPAVLIDPPGAGEREAASGSQAIRMERLEIRGTATDAPAIDGSAERPDSVLADSCIAIPDAGPADVVDVRTRNVGYGVDCDASQLIAGAVGVPADVPEIENARVPPPTPGSGLLGVGFVLALGSTIALAMGTLLPAVLDWVRARIPGV